MEYMTTVSGEDAEEINDQANKDQSQTDMSEALTVDTVGSD